MTFKEHIIKKRFIWLAVLVFTLICRGEMMLSNSVGIDTTEVIVNPDGIYDSWLGIGRQGLVFLKWLTGLWIYNSYVVGIGSILFLSLACILWSYLFAYISGKESPLATLFFSGILVSHTILTEQLYFKLQAFEITLSLCLMAIIILCAHIFAQKKKVVPLLIAIPLMLIVFSVYQVMNALFLFGAVACFFLYYFFDATEQEDYKSNKQLWMYILRFAIVFLIGFILNQGITTLFFSSADYVNNQMLWGQLSFMDSVLSILSHVKQVALGEKIFYIRTFLILAILLLIQVTSILKKTKVNTRYLGVLCSILLLMSPFYMTLFTGGLTVARSQLVLPFTIAFMGYLVCLFVVPSEKMQKWTKVAACIICCVTLICQTTYTLRMNHTNELRYESDVQIANALIQDIMQYQNADCSRPVVFIGGYEEALEDGLMYGDCLGHSVLNWDTEVEPKGYHSTMRIINFMELQGTKFNAAHPDEILYANQLSHEMQNWPANDSIRLVMDLIIVKLGN